MSTSSARRTNPGPAGQARRLQVSFSKEETERTLLLDMIADIGTNRVEYIYDFGDHWSHTIKIVKPMPAVPGIAYPLLIDAVGRSPPEDSGGPPGYMEMLEALRDPAHPRHAEAIERLGRDFNADDGNRPKPENCKVEERRWNAAGLHPFCSGRCSVWGR